LTEQEKCRVIQAAADEKKARDIVQMDMVGLMSTNDYFIICSANTATQVRAIADNIEEKMEEAGVSFLHKEGYREGEWVLLDYGDTVAHIFQQDAREYYALEGLSQLMRTVALVKERLNQKLGIEGIVFTMYDGRTNLSLQVVENVKDHIQERVFKTIIPRNIRLAEAPSYGKPINLYEPRSAGAEAYRLLAEEIMEDNDRK